MSSTRNATDDDLRSSLSSACLEKDSLTPSSFNLASAIHRSSAEMMPKLLDGEMTRMVSPFLSFCGTSMSVFIDGRAKSVGIQFPHKEPFLLWATPCSIICITGHAHHVCLNGYYVV